VTLTFEPLTPVFGATVAGIDITGDVSDEAIAEIQWAFEEYSVLVFHGQPLDDETQLAFSRRFGPLEDSLASTGGGGGYFARLTNVKEDGSLADPNSQRQLFSKANEFWHTDSSFKPVPARASLLSGRLVPPEGGETEFASARAAFAMLPEETQRRLEGMICEHDLSRSREMISPDAMTDAQRAAYPPVFHTMVRANPVNGRKALFLGTHVTRIVGVPDDDSRTLIDELMELITRPEFVYRHVWAQDDLVMWDNRCVLHRGRPWDATKYGRTVQRTTLAGDGPTVSA